jgi:hypothetical protein
LIAVDSALNDRQSAISNLLGTNAKSSLWTTLFDAHFLLLRFAYGESLNADCGGGSLASNCSLLFFHLSMAEMFEKNAQLEQPEQSQHVRGLSAGFLAACAMMNDKETSTMALARGIADAASMSALTCILFHNQRDDTGGSEEEITDRPHLHRRWLEGREYFLRGMVVSAGRRKALGISGSGCLPIRSVTKRLRSSSFADWDGVASESAESSSSKRLTIDDFQNALRPAITLFAIFEKMSSEYIGQMDDCRIQEASERLVGLVESCLRCKSIHELLTLAKVDLESDELMKLLQNGMVAA